MERAGLGPLGFVATDYVMATWSLERPEDLASLFAEDMLGDDLEAWMDESSLMKRTFRKVAIIAGLIERRSPGQEKSSRQISVQFDLIYDVLREQRARPRAAARHPDGRRPRLTDIERVGALLKRAKGRIHHRRLDRVSPLAVPVLLEVGANRSWRRHGHAAARDR